ncbi:hypothetical protein [Cryptosporangium sp. NPDC048952]|uniref:hypothetical protein n=1 Tax=Cryptosporangium sp. NPDC048952 TaxID=3363961 RepID=UPI003710960F
MTTLDKAAIEHRLITIRKTVVQLESAGRVDVSRLDQYHGHGIAIERMLAILDDLAFAINRHVAVVVLGEAPPTSEASFAAAQKAGLIDEELAIALTPEDGPHNVLVQLSLDAEPGAIEGIVAGAIAAYQEYARQVAGWTSAQ